MAIKMTLENPVPGNTISDLLKAADPPSPNNDYAPKANWLDASDYFDGVWHAVYVHLKAETDVGARDAVFEAWIDGLKVFDQRGFGSGVAGPGEGFTGLALGRNHNTAPDNLQDMWFGRIRVWTTDPQLHN